MRIMAWPLARPDSVVLVCGLVRPNLGHPMRTLTLLFHSLRMEERFGGSDWSKSRHFYSPDVDLESGVLELETGESLGGSFSHEATIAASLHFHLTPTEPVAGIPAESEMRYCPEIDYSDGDGGIGSFIVFDIIASPSRYRELLTNVRHGLVPRNISIKLAEDEKFWRSIDPTSKWSRKIWQNQVDSNSGWAVIPIEDYAFSYLIKKGRRPGT